MPEADVFGALANPVRRELLGLLRERESVAVAELAAHFDLQRPSVSEHLKVLRDAGLVSERRAGRHRLYRLEAAPLLAVSQWLTPYERFWRGKLSNLRELLDETDDDA